jgi:hypothetical protein
MGYNGILEEFTVTNGNIKNIAWREEPGQIKK